jgi:hypothetical protein
MVHSVSLIKLCVLYCICTPLVICGEIKIFCSLNWRYIAVQLTALTRATWIGVNGRESNGNDK